MIAGLLAHLPSSAFTVNAAWLTYCTVIADNPLRATGLHSWRVSRHQRATRRLHPIDVPTRFSFETAKTICLRSSAATRVRANRTEKDQRPQVNGSRLRGRLAAQVRKAEEAPEGL
ncbi:hypothetical protein Mame01_35430 [Microbispora amethystogenes]|nr:hypothetical protein Mame01_35430 [Microbispora amethystogenes]